MVKVSQIVASASGAVASAVIASFFGVKGTIIGVAIGSAVATTASALVVKSLERTHRVVRHVVIDQNPLVRRVGGTAAAGVPPTPGSPPTIPPAGSPPAAAAGTDAAPSGSVPTVPRRPIARSGGSTGPPARPAGTAPSARRGSTVVPSPSRIHTVRRGRRQGRARWLLTGVAAFAVALLVVTVIEVGVGRPLAALVGGSKASGGTTAGNLVGGTPPATSTTTTAATTTTTTAAPSSTSTTAPRSTGPSSTTTSTSTTTTTTAPSSTSTTLPGAPAG